MKLGRLLSAAILIVVCFIADRISKYWAQNYLSSSICKPFVPGFLRLVLVSNTGGAFGIAHGNNLFMTVLASAIVIGVSVWAWRRENQLSLVQWCGIGFLIGGALGNLWDRVTLGYVTDFLDFAFINFPVFNLSDVFVDVGVGLILLGSIYAGRGAVVCGAEHSARH